MKFRPLHDRVVVKRVAEEEKTKGGIIIPDTAKEKPMEGEVVSVGPGARDEKGTLVAPDVKAGDRILFGKWSGTEIKLDGVEYLIMKESDIMGILEGSAVATQEGRLSAFKARIAPPSRQSHTSTTRGIKQWQPRKSALAAMPVSACCAASTFSPTRSR